MKIKCRVWDISDKKYLAPDSYFLSNNEDGLAALKLGLGQLDDFDHVIQFSTGLKDKNGVEIFEGDIFEGKHSEWGPVEYNNGTYQVNLMGARVFDLSEFFEYGEHGMPQPPLVIGNIHEN